MKKNFIRIILMAAGLTGILMFPFHSVVRTGFTGNMLIICNKGVPDTSLSRKDVRDIYIGKKIQWNDNSKIIFVTLKDAKIHEAFLKDYVGKTPFQYTSFWRNQLYTGKGSLPKAFENEKELAEYVANTGGAVGYVSAGFDAGSLKIMPVE